MEDEDFNDPPAPSADKVARQAIGLAPVACHGIVETDRANLAYEWQRALGFEEKLSAGVIAGARSVRRPHIDRHAIISHRVFPGIRVLNENRS